MPATSAPNHTAPSSFVMLWKRCSYLALHPSAKHTCSLRPTVCKHGASTTRCGRFKSSSAMACLCMCVIMQRSLMAQALQSSQTCFIGLPNCLSRRSSHQTPRTTERACVQAYVMLLLLVIQAGSTNVWHHPQAANVSQGALGEYVRAQQLVLDMVQAGITPAAEDFASLIASYGNAAQVCWCLYR